MQNNENDDKQLQSHAQPKKEFPGILEVFLRELTTRDPEKTERMRVYNEIANVLSTELNIEDGEALLVVFYTIGKDDLRDLEMDGREIPPKPPRQLLKQATDLLLKVTVTYRNRESFLGGSLERNKLPTINKVISEIEVYLHHENGIAPVVRKEIIVELLGEDLPGFIRRELMSKLKPVSFKLYPLE